MTLSPGTTVVCPRSVLLAQHHDASSCLVPGGTLFTVVRARTRVDLDLRGIHEDGIVLLRGDGALIAAREGDVSGAAEPT